MVDAQEKAMEDARPQNPLFSLLSSALNFLQSILAGRPRVVAEDQPAEANSVASEEERVGFVRFGYNPTVSSLKLEPEDLPPDTTPAALLQIYALGGFIVMKWALARWKERTRKAESSDDEQSVLHEE